MSSVLAYFSVLRRAILLGEEVLPSASGASVSKMRWVKTHPTSVARLLRLVWIVNRDASAYWSLCNQ
ncbi:hypothetical protein P168DRAFT_291652 [Aspergillus campestris IBT 28561]|uniref:Uncharacterized protein n=1 Tax=Aspergillus campestris (strain IBT 28561) TaxID=1392248 RepID=A0A2I1CY13_ASPC2|nr:uncharacterized protein P168DRAFT_291652 [Aspergillus campestris IBT 28561]PKY02507.1 hypothetical protein P168DRAFT_291652 [Aspergillus campestris IBT 28561]